MKHFGVSHFLLALSLVWAYWYGNSPVLFTVMMLIALEVSVSFDNAVINAKVLSTMEPKWQKRFITWGIPIAVFGMRLVFPVVIVAVAAGITIENTVMMAINNPVEYHHALEANEKTIFAFGGSFLLMVFLTFFFDEEREVKWIKHLEDNKLINKLSSVHSISIMITSMLGIYLISLTNSTTIAIAYFAGIILFEALKSLDVMFESESGVRSGLVGFLYLEVLDASFSFDGVIGAFALSSNIFVIMVGLGVGAMYVRSITTYLVEKQTLTEYKYLEHGAHYAIGALALIMLLKMFTQVEELVVGGIGIAFIVISLIHSKLEKTVRV